MPKHLLSGLLTSLHLQLNHASAYQLQKVFARSYFCQGAVKCVATVVGNCHVCQSLKVVPRELHKQSSSDFPVTPTRSYAVDVIRRHGQKIFVLTDTFSTFVNASLISDETSSTLKNSLIPAVSSIRPNPQTNVTVRSDNASGFKSLNGDPDLKRLRITMDFGRTVNKNKNPVVDKSISELITEILKICPDGGRITPVMLSYAVNILNSRIRNRGLSAWEILFQRDQYTFEPLNISDIGLASEQQDTRSKNQISSAKSKSRNAPDAVACNTMVGSLVYLKDDGNKEKSRERYLIVGIEDNFYIAQKLNRSLRNVRYKVKPTEVFPVTPTINDACVRSEDNDIEEDEEIRDNVYCDVTSPSIVQHTDDILVAPSVEYAPALVNEPPDPYVPDERPDTSTPNIDELAPPDPMSIAVDQVDIAVAVPEALPGSVESHHVEAPPRSRPRRNAGRPKRFAEYELY